MSEQERCKYRAYCVQDCPAKLAHSDDGCIAGMRPGCPYRGVAYCVPVEQGPYRVCTLCVRTDRPACCIPVEQPAPEPPAPVDLDAIRECNAKAAPDVMTVMKMCDEIERLRKANSYQGGYIAGLEHLRDETVPALERDNTVLRTMLREAQDPSIAAQEEIERLRGMLVKRFRQLQASRERLRQQRHEMYDEVEQLEQDRNDLRAKLAELNALAIARWLTEIADEPLPDYHTTSTQCSAARTCVADCKLMKAHEHGTHVNCGVLHFCVWVREDVRCAGVAG